MSGNASGSEALLRAELTKFARKQQQMRAAAFAAVAGGAGLCVQGPATVLGAQNGTLVVMVVSLAAATVWGWLWRRPALVEVAHELDLRFRKHGVHQASEPAPESAAHEDALLLASDWLQRPSQLTPTHEAVKQLCLLEAERVLRLMPMSLRTPRPDKRLLLLASALGLMGGTTLHLFPPRHGGGIADARSRSGSHSPSAARGDGRGRRAGLTAGGGNDGTRPQSTSDQDVGAAVQSVRRARAIESATLALGAVFAQHPNTSKVATALAARDPLAMAEATNQWQQELEGAERNVLSGQLAGALSRASEAIASAAGRTGGVHSDAPGRDSSNVDALPELERLERALSRAAADCAHDPRRCQDALSQLEPELESLAREEAQAQEEQLRQPDGPQAGAPATNQPSSPDRGPPGADRSTDVEAGDRSPEGRTGDLASSSHARAPSSDTGQTTEAHVEATELIESSSAGSGSAPPRDDTAAGPPLAARHRDLAVALPPTPPNRAELVAATAASGFATPAYRATYSEYRTVVEETLERASVSAGRRHLVRRYFHRIRPVLPAENQ